MERQEERFNSKGQAQHGDTQTIASKNSYACSEGAMDSTLSQQKTGMAGLQQSSIQANISYMGQGADP